MSYSFTIFLKDYASSTVSKISESLGRMDSKLRSIYEQHPANIRKTTRSIDELNEKLKNLNAQRTASTSISDIRRLKAEINKTEREIKKLENLPPKGFGERLKSFGGQLGGLVGLAGGLGLAMQAWGGIKALFNKGVELEQANTKFEVLLGSADKAKKMMSDLTSYADKTPYSFDGMQKGAETMLGFGIAEEKILPSMKMLGDVAMGNDEKLSGLSLVYSQIMATGRLMGQDLMQLINQGFNPLQIISEQTGLSMGDLKKKMEDGAISSDMVSEAFRIATSEGGRYHDMANKMSENAGGKWSTMMDTFENVAKKVGLRFAEWVKPIFDVGTSFAEKIIPFGKWIIDFLPSMETFTTVLQVLGIAAAAVGAYMLVANAAAILYAIDLAILNGVIWLVEAAQWAWNLAMSLNPIGIVIAAIVALVAVVVLLWNKFGWFRGAVLGVWEVLKGLGTMIENYVINRFTELLNGITGIGKALVSFIKGDFEGAIKQGAEAGKNLLGVNSKAQALKDGKAAFGAFSKGWEEGNKETPKTIKGVQKTNEKAKAGQPKSDLFNSLLGDKGGKDKKDKSKHPAKEKSNGIVSGGSKQTNITIHIGKLNEKIEVYTTNLKEGGAEIEQKVQEVLLRAVNSVNQMQTA